MKSFEQLYLETADLFESGHFKSPKWINTVTTNLRKLGMMWPNHDYLELSEIVKLCTPEVVYSMGCIEKIATTIRNNARSAVKRAKEISLYCGAKGNTLFTLDNFDDLCDRVGILPLGISFTEKQILQVLNNCGSATLTGLSAKLGLSKSAVQRDHELYLLNKNLIEIDGKRKITSHGLKLCESL